KKTAGGSPLNGQVKYSLRSTCAAAYENAPHLLRMTVFRGGPDNNVAVFMGQGWPLLKAQSVPNPPMSGAGPFSRDELVQGAEAGLELLFGVEVAGGDADGAVGEGAEGFVGVGGAVEAGSDGDGEGIVEDAAGFLGRVAGDVEADGADAILGGF